MMSIGIVGMPSSVSKECLGAKVILPDLLGPIRTASASFGIEALMHHKLRKRPGCQAAVSRSEAGRCVAAIDRSIRLLSRKARTSVAHALSYWGTPVSQFYGDAIHESISFDLGNDTMPPPLVRPEDPYPTRALWPETALSAKRSRIALTRLILTC